MTDETKISLIQIPGVFYVELDETEETPRVERFVFMPHGSNAGYFGPSAEYSSRASFHHTMEPLDLEDTDGPFWKAVQHALETFTYTAVAEPDEEPDEIVLHRIPIVWEE